MSLELIRTALFNHLTALSPPWPTAWENAAFRPPRKQAWQEVALMTDALMARALGDGGRRSWAGHLRVTLHHPLDAGTAAVDQRVDALLTHFERGRVLGEGGLRVTLEQGRPDPAERRRDYWRQSVRLPWTVHL